MDPSLRANMPPADSWTLEGDGKLLEYMESIAKNLENRSNQTIKDMNSMMLSVDVASVDLDNAANRLQRLQQTQFIENRVQEEDVTMTTEISSGEKSIDTLLSDVDATKIVMNDSLKMLEKCYEKISVEDEEEDDSDVEDQCLRHIYKPINPYDKRTPYIICTKEWLEKWHIGLKDDSDNEEPENEINDDDSISDTLSQTRIVPEAISVKSDFDELSNNESEQDNVIHVQVPNMSSKLSEILNTNRGHLVLPVAPRETTVPEKVSQEPSFFRNQTTTTSNAPQHFTQNFFDDEPPELDNVSVGNRSTQAPNLFTQSDDENENFIKSTPEKPDKPIPVVNTSNNSNYIPVNTQLDEPDRIVTQITKIDKNVDNILDNTPKSIIKSFNTSKVSNLFESDTDDDEDYFDIIRKSNKKSATKPLSETMSVNLVKEDSPKILPTPVKQSDLTALNTKNASVPVKEDVHIKSVQKKAPNLFEDSEEEDDFFTIKPKSAILTKQSVSEKKESPSKVPIEVKNDKPIVPKADPVIMESKASAEKENNQIQPIKAISVKNVIENETKPVKSEEKLKPVSTPKKPVNTLFGSSDDENDFLMPSATKSKAEKPKVASKPVNVEIIKEKVDTGVQQNKHLLDKAISVNIVHDTSKASTTNVSDFKDLDNPVKNQTKPLFESSDDENDFLVATPLKPKVDENLTNKSDLINKPEPETQSQLPKHENIQETNKSLKKLDLSFDSFSLPPEDNSSELFSPQSDAFFTPTDTTPNTTTTTATPITPVYRSFIDELPPDDDFSEAYDTNEFDTGYNPDDNENFEENNVLIATDPFLISDEPPELTKTPEVEVKVPVVEENKVVKEKESSPESFKNKFKMFENTSDSSKSPPKLEKPVKAVPKKLNVNLNINVSALLPGAKRPSPKMNDEPIKEAIPDDDKPASNNVVEKVSDPIIVTPKKESSNDTSEKQPNLLVSLNKNRVRAPTTRKPSTRKARVQSYHESTHKTDEILINEDTVKSEIQSKVPPLSVAEMLRTAKLKDQLSRRSLNFDEVDELHVPSVIKKSIEKKPVVASVKAPEIKPVIPVEKEPEVIKKQEEPKSTVVKDAISKSSGPIKGSPNRKPILFDDDDDPMPLPLDPPTSEIFKKVQIKEISKPVHTKTKETPKSKIFDSDSDDDLFSPKTVTASVKKALSKPEMQESKNDVQKPDAPVTKLPKLFDDSEDDDLFSAKSAAKLRNSKKSQEVVKSVNIPAPKVSTETKKQVPNKTKSLFGSDDEDDDLFGGGKTSKPLKTAPKQASKPLFGDELDDDDSLFSTGSRKAKTTKPDLSKPKAAGAVKKSSTVVNDPLADLFK